jgi:AmmeMemoRadiSam system radical SAM enzyme/AmmeMemoRadiSam system protein B/AmmeMemoRadiSam system protein A
VTQTILLPPDVPRLPDGAKTGGWWHTTDEPGRIVCDLCPRACALRPGDKGFCFVRENRDGQMVLTTYGRSTGFCIDPIEKKPLNHFYPGTSVLSFGTAGCNLGCKFCQNWSISKSREIERLSETASPAAVAIAANELDCRSVAFTYNDPVIWAEYAIDAAKECRARGIKTVAVTAGYITPQARGPFYEVMDAANVDLKGFTEEFYQKLTLSHLQPVLNTLRWLKHETNVWFEITNLMIPRANDSPDEVKQMCDWLLEAIGPDVPIHFTAFHPDFRLMDREGTPPETLLMAYDIAVKAGLNYVYVGNILANRHQSTLCPQCRKVLIERRGYEICTYSLRGNQCQSCGTTIPGHFDAAPGNWGSRRLPVRISNFEPASDEPAKAPLMQISPSESATPIGVSLTSQQQRAVLNAAASTLVERVTQPSMAANSAQDDLAGAASMHVFGAFVTVKRQGKLRSCCGAMGPKMTLAESVRHAAERTADDDPRFPPLSATELAYLDMDVWVLFNPQPIVARGVARHEAVIVGKHGLIVEREGKRGLLLPGVAIEHGFDAETFLAHTCLKAELPAVAWREDATTVSTFEGLAIESPLGALLDELYPTGIPEGTVFPIEPHDVPRLAEFARANILALVTGATPSYYSPGTGDGNVHGLIVSVVGPDGTEWIQSNKLSVRDKFPLQATLFKLCEGLAQALRRQNISHRDLHGLNVQFAVLNDPAMHGTVAEADLRGYLPVERALAVLDRNKMGLVFRTDRCKDDILAETADLAEITTTNPASVNSFAILTNAPQVRMARVPQATRGPFVRPPAVAGKFYPADPQELSRLVDRCLAGEPVERRPCPAVMVPHAGLIYSGQLAAEVLRRVEIPETVIVIGPKHTRHGVEWAVAPHEAWQIPGATIPSDPELAKTLCDAIPGLMLDAAAHAQEHAIEVELPFLARLAPHAKVVGIVVGGGDLSGCRKFARGLANVIRTLPQPPLLVISSDMNHFADDAQTRIVDEMALAAFETLDPARLYETVIGNRITMCGILPATIVLESLGLLGRVSGMERIGYATSGDVSGDRARVVGYAGLHLLA